MAATIREGLDHLVENGPTRHARIPHRSPIGATMRPVPCVAAFALVVAGSACSDAPYNAPGQGSGGSAFSSAPRTNDAQATPCSPADCGPSIGHPSLQSPVQKLQLRLRRVREA